MTMIERVARAILRRQGWSNAEIDNEALHTNPLPHWTEALADARAAIEAMREPTEVMLYALEDRTEAWEAAITAALEDSDG